MLRLEYHGTHGIVPTITGMRNPLNSWDRIDSQYMFYPGNLAGEDPMVHKFELGPRDLELAQGLIRSGSDHRKFLRMLTVYITVDAPLYWWKEYDTYKVGTVANSCSTMHTITKKKFELSDFSYEHLLSSELELNNFVVGEDGDYITCGVDGLGTMSIIVQMLNFYREKFLKTNDKIYWWQLIQLLPSSFNQKRTLSLSYETLLKIYYARKNHKLDEWHTFCDFIKNELTYGKEFITFLEDK